jgi:hypothetical protein
MPALNSTVRVADDCAAIPPEVSRAATRYQVYREVEAAHLSIMAQHNLLLDWTPAVRQMVFTAGEHIRHARDARSLFREQVRQHVLTLRRSSESLSDVLRETRSLISRLERSGALRGDGGDLEAEVVGWAIEEYGGVA